ncbi:MAG: hypothetical protein Tsb005_07960 [Gammaproteobacteria bacterium]
MEFSSFSKQFFDSSLFYTDTITYFDNYKHYGIIYAVQGFVTAYRYNLLDIEGKYDTEQLINAIESLLVNIEQDINFVTLCDKIEKLCSALNFKNDINELEKKIGITETQKITAKNNLIKKILLHVTEDKVISQAIIDFTKAMISLMLDQKLNLVFFNYLVDSPYFYSEKTLPEKGKKAEYEIIKDLHYLLALHFGIKSNYSLDIDLNELRKTITNVTHYQADAFLKYKIFACNLLKWCEFEKLSISRFYSASLEKQHATTAINKTKYQNIQNKLTAVVACLDELFIPFIPNLADVSSMKIFLPWWKHKIEILMKLSEHAEYKKFKVIYDNAEPVFAKLILLPRVQSKNMVFEQWYQITTLNDVANCFVTIEEQLNTVAELLEENEFRKALVILHDIKKQKESDKKLFVEANCKQQFDKLDQNFKTLSATWNSLHKQESQAKQAVINKYARKITESGSLSFNDLQQIQLNLKVIQESLTKFNQDGQVKQCVKEVTGLLAKIDDEQQQYLILLEKTLFAYNELHCELADQSDANQIWYTLRAGYLLNLQKFFMKHGVHNSDKIRIKDEDIAISRTIFFAMLQEEQTLFITALIQFKNNQLINLLRDKFPVWKINEHAKTLTISNIQQTCSLHRKKLPNFIAEKYQKITADVDAITFSFAELLATDFKLSTVIECLNDLQRHHPRHKDILVQKLVSDDRDVHKNLVVQHAGLVADDESLKAVSEQSTTAQDLGFSAFGSATVKKLRYSGTSIFSRYCIVTEMADNLSVSAQKIMQDDEWQKHLALIEKAEIANKALGKAGFKIYPNGIKSYPAGARTKVPGTKYGLFFEKVNTVKTAEGERILLVPKQIYKH